MPPQMPRYGGPNNLASHYAQYPNHSQSHTPGLPPPSLGNAAFMNANSMSNPFSVNGNALGMSGTFGASGLGMPGGTGLASQAAQMSFAGASLQQQAHNGIDGSSRAGQNKGRVKDVWKSNLSEEMANIRQLVDKYNYIAMDTEFPGIVARPMGTFRGKSDYHYQCLRCNVDLLKIIQLGITLYTEDGESPPANAEANMDPRKYGTQAPCTWQFNFKFSARDDMYNELSMKTLQDAEVNFEKLEHDGINPFDFGALLMSSGLVCDENVRWISFHGGYDFGYLTKVLLCKPLPDDEREFDMLVKKFFPAIYDIKYLTKWALKQHNMGQLTPLDPATTEILTKFEQKGSLEGIADSLKVKRIGAAHTAGSDAMLTGKTFFKLRERMFNGEISDEHVGKVWGLGYPESSSQHTPSSYTQQQLQENTTPNHASQYANGTPSTPDARNVGLVSTPAHSNGGVGPLTPGGGGGVFGSFFKQ